MNEERAKKVLQEQIDKYGQEYDAEGIEALEMAIKALEQESITWIVGKDNCQVAVRNMPSDKIQKICAIIRDEEQQPCEDCISREAVRRILANQRDELVKLHTVNPKDNPKADAMAYGVNWSLNTLMELPSVIPQRPKGKWIEEKGEYGVWSCSECKELFILTEGTPMDNEFHYCPNCGAEMEGDND